MAQFGIRCEPGHLERYRKINLSWWQALEQGRTTPAKLKVGRFAELLTALDADAAAEKLSQVYLERLGEARWLLDGAAEVLGRLQQSYRLAIVTNGLTKVQRNRMAGSGLEPFISKLFISEEMGAAKPAPEFFDHVFERLGQPPRQEVLMVGDSWSSDVAGAANYGLDVCWFNPAGKPRPEEPPITHEIQSLRQLPEWLG